MRQVLMSISNMMRKLVRPSLYNFKKRLMKKTIIVLSILLMTSCTSIGPDQINIDRSRYNDVIADTQDEQLLKNLVRLRYMHQVSILEITNVITSYKLERSVFGEAKLTHLPISKSPKPISKSAKERLDYRTNGFGSITPRISYSDQPTITYKPIEDAAFIRRMLIPLEVHFLNLLVSGGMHDPHLIFNLTIKHLNSMANDNDNRDLAILANPHDRRFYHVSLLLDKLSVKRGVRLVPAVVEGTETIAILFPHPFQHSPEAKEIKTLLHIPDKYDKIILYYKRLPIQNLAVIHTRSLLGTMFFISKGIHAPEEHNHDHIVRQYQSADHHQYNWNPLMKNIFEIYSSKKVPLDAYLAVHIYNYWFYIKRGDIPTIATFTYLRTLHSFSTSGELKNLGYDVISNSAKGTTP